MELLVRIIDKPKTGNPVTDAQRTTAGDVIAARPDESVWGLSETANPEYRIVRVLRMTEAEAEALTAGELPADFEGRTLLRKRHLAIDIPALNSRANGRLLSEVQPGVDLTISMANLRPYLFLKPPVADPSIIGPDAGVIG